MDGEGGRAVERKLWRNAASDEGQDEEHCSSVLSSDVEKIGPVCHERPIRQRAKFKRKIPNLRPGTDAIETAGHKGELNPQLANLNPKPITYQSTTTASTDSTSARCVPAGTELLCSQHQ